MQHKTKQKQNEVAHDRAIIYRTPDLRKGDKT